MPVAIVRWTRDDLRGIEAVAVAGPVHDPLAATVHERRGGGPAVIPLAAIAATVAALEQLVVLAGDSIDMGKHAAGQAAEGDQGQTQSRNNHSHVELIPPGAIVAAASLEGDIISADCLFSQSTSHAGPGDTKEDINPFPKASAHHGNRIALRSLAQGTMEGWMAAEAIVLWLCGAGALGGLIIRFVSELQTTGLL